MKKTAAFVLLLILTLSLVSCTGIGEVTEFQGSTSDVREDDTEIRVAVLNGTTGFGIAPLYNDIRSGESQINARIDFYADPTLVAPLVIGGNIDIAAVPTNLASVLYNKTQGAIEVLAVNTLGVLYAVENGNTVNTLADLEGKTVYLPGSGSNPEYVLKALLKLAGLEEKVTLDYTYATPDELTAALASGKAAIGVIPEPKVTAAMTKNAELRIAIDFSKEWKTLTGSELVQGCLIARKAFVDEHPMAVEAFLAAYEASVKKLNSDLEAGARAVVEAGIANNEALVKNAIPRCNITYLVGDDMKNGLNSFWKALFEQVPSSVGGVLPDENIFG